MTQRKTVATGRDVQADELRTAKGAGEAQEQQRAVPGAQEVVRQLRQHVAQVCDEDRGLTLLCGPVGAPDAGPDFPDGRVARVQPVAGALVGLADSG